MARQSFLEPANINRQPSAPEPVASITLPRKPLTAFLRERLARRDAEFARLHEAFIAREDLVLKLISPLPTAALTEAMLRSQVATPQTSLFSARARLASARSSTNSATSALNVTSSDNKRRESQVCELSATVDDTLVQLSIAQSSISPMAFESLRSERDQHLGLLHFSVFEFDRLDNDFSTLLTQVQDSRTTLRRNVGPLLEKFRVLAEEEYVLEIAIVPSSTD